MLTIAQIPLFVVGLLVAFFVVVSVMMILIVLIQRPQGGGLSEAFGSSSGSGHTAFGAKTGDALTVATIFIFVVFIGFAIGLNYIVKPPSALTPPSGEVVPVSSGEISPEATTPPPAPTGGETAPATQADPAAAPTGAAPTESAPDSAAPPVEAPPANPQNPEQPKPQP